LKLRGRKGSSHTANMEERLYPAECPNCNAPILDDGKCSQCEFAFAGRPAPVKKRFDWDRLARFSGGVFAFSVMAYLLVGIHPGFHWSFRAFVAYLGVLIIIYGLSAIPMERTGQRWTFDFLNVFGIREGEGLSILDLVALLVGGLLIAAAFRESFW
jgi:hypothetical protein